MFPFVGALMGAALYVFVLYTKPLLPPSVEMLLLCGVSFIFAVFYFEARHHKRIVEFRKYVISVLKRRENWKKILAAYRETEASPVSRSRKRKPNGALLPRKDLCVILPSGAIAKVGFKIQRRPKMIIVDYIFEISRYNAEARHYLFLDLSGATGEN